MTSYGAIDFPILAMDDRRLELVRYFKIGLCFNFTVFKNGFGALTLYGTSTYTRHIMSLLLPISTTKTATTTVAGIWPWLSLHGEVLHSPCVPGYRGS